MKKGIVVAVVLTLSCFTYGQPVETDPTPTVGQEFRKAGTQKRIGIATLAAGSTLALVGGGLYLSEFGDGLPGGTGYNAGVAQTGEVLFYTGIGLVAASALLFGTDRKQRRITNGLRSVPFLEMETALQPGARRMARYPCLGLQVGL